MDINLDINLDIDLDINLDIHLDTHIIWSQELYRHTLVLHSLLLQLSVHFVRVIKWL